MIMTSALLRKQTHHNDSKARAMNEYADTHADGVGAG